MLKQVEIEQKALEALNDCFSAIPGIKLEVLPKDQATPNADFVLRIVGKDWEQLIYAEVKTLGTPKRVREAVNSLARMMGPEKVAYGIVVVPFISNNTAAICQAEGIGYMDLSGNCYLQFKQILMSKENFENKFKFKSGISSIYSPKSERILRVLLNYPYQGWRVIDLAKEADVSLGMITQVSKKLIEEEWMNKSSDGIVLSQPGLLLEDWTENYTIQRNELLNYYTLLPLQEIEQQLGQVCDAQGIQFALTGFSAASKIAPMVKGQRSMMYIGSELERLVEQVDLKKVESGANVLLIRPYDEGVFWKSELVGKSIFANPIQVYLDLKRYPGRGEEAANQILEEVIKPRWQQQKMNTANL